MSAEKAVVLPDLGAPVPDTHAHLDYLEDPVGALERAALAGVSFVCTIVMPTEQPEKTFDGLQGWLDEARRRLAGRAIEPPDVVIAVGVHPHDAKDFAGDTPSLIRRLAADPRVAALGEIGLDYHYDHSPRDEQRRIFGEQLALASELDLPAIVHLREAHDDGLAIMREVGLPSKGCVLHCYTEGPETVGSFLDIGCHISFAGPVTFAKADAIREAAKLVPLDRLLTETDCPYLAPAPYRGRTNEPALVTVTAAKLAEVRAMPAAELASAVLANARSLFGRPQ